jgi:hypothetical protein
MVRHATASDCKINQNSSGEHAVPSQAIHVAIPPAERERGNVLPAGMQLKIEDEGA